MTLSSVLLPEFDKEMASTRATLERIPEDKLGWKPHEKSMPLGRLAGHLAELVWFGKAVIEQDSLDFAPPGGSRPMQPTVAASREHVLGVFDKNTTEARAAIASASDDHLSQPWALLSGGKTFISDTRINMLRRMVMNHIIHHRAQLGVYLRLNDVALPSIYGPSADEGARPSAA